MKVSLWGIFCAQIVYILCGLISFFLRHLERKRRRDEVFALYCQAEEAWQEYRIKTGDNCPAMDLSGTEEKDRVRDLYRKFFWKMDAWKASNQEPAGRKWIMSSDGLKLYRIPK